MTSASRSGRPRSGRHSKVDSGPLSARNLRRSSRVLAVIGVILIVVATRVVLSSRSELANGDQAREQSDLEAALVHYRRAAKWYAPGNPYCTDALERLADMGRDAEQNNDTEAALAAWRGVRGSILSTRSSYMPHTTRLQQANDRIASLMASLEPPPMDAGKSEETLRAEHLALLQTIPRPHTGWTFLLLLGFATWITSAFLFAQRGIDAEDRFVRREAIRWGTLVLLGFATFALGLAFA